jgi:uncharacterized protein YndB with AHSA1/START domain
MQAMALLKRKPGLLEQAVDCSTLVRAPRERVYDAIATAEGLDAWLTRGATVHAHPGGDIVFRWHEWGPDRDTLEDGGPVLEAVRPERLVFQWRPDNPSYLTTVEIDFVEDPRGTVVRLCEYGFEDTPEGLEALMVCANGWGEALTLLKFYVEHGLRY